MFFGQTWGAFGDPDKHISNLEAVATPSGAKVRIKASTGLGDAYYQVYVNNVFAGAVWCPEGLTSDWINVVVPTAGSPSIVCFRVGSQPFGDNSEFARLEEEAPQQVTANWSWDYEVLGTPDSLKLTSWTVAGLRKVLMQPTDRTTRGEVPVSMTVSGSTATINVGTLASGSGSLGTTVTLTAINDSGVSGSVAVAADAVTAEATLSARWPEKMRILRDTTSPPTTTIDTVRYDEEDNGKKVDEDVLTAGTYYYALTAISDTDDVGDQSSPTTIVVAGAPDAPEDLAYVSGGASATNISWTASTTSGATYNIYVQNPDDEYMDTETATQTAVAGSTGATLPAITGAPGRAQVLVRAEKSGVEEKNGDFLTIDYTNTGVYIPERPNAPEIRSVIVSDGLTLGATITYTSKDEKATPATVELYTRLPSGSYDFDTPDASVALSTAGVGGIRKALASSTKTADGWYYVTAKSVTAGDVSSDGNAPEVAVYLSDDNLAAPVGTFELTRG